MHLKLSNESTCYVQIKRLVGIVLILLGTNAWSKSVNSFQLRMNRFTDDVIQWRILSADKRLDVIAVTPEVAKLLEQLSTESKRQEVEYECSGNFYRTRIPIKIQVITPGASASSLELASLFELECKISGVVFSAEDTEGVQSENKIESEPKSRSWFGGGKE